MLYVKKYKKHVSPANPTSSSAPFQSLWIFMGKRKLYEAIRTSLENFGQFDHYDPKGNFEQRHADIVPLYALTHIGH